MRAPTTTGYPKDYEVTAHQDFPLDPGDTTEVAMLSPCVGGQLRTWTDTGPSRLWQVSEPHALHSLQGTGYIARTLREERRFREVALLCEEKGALMIQPRFPRRVGDDLNFDATMLNLKPAREAQESVFVDFHSLLAQSVRHTVAANGFLVVEKGGWDAPNEPYCMFILTATDDDNTISVIETAPQPSESELWAPHNIPGLAGATMQAPASEETIGAVPMIMMSAISTWGIQPWDLALTFGTR